MDDETTVFEQKENFRLISDHHVQKGPAFPKALDALVEGNGMVTIKGETTTSERMDLPPDVYNGLQFAVLLNIAPTSPETKIAFVAPSGKGRLIHLSITRDGEDNFTAAGVKRKAANYRLHVELGGITGLIAPIIGKEPPDIHIWVLQGQAPAIVKVEAPFYEGGPIWRVELAAPVWAGEESRRR